MQTTMQDLLKAGVHFGRRTSRWNPKMKKFIYTQREGIHIIDLQKSLEKLKEAQEYLKQIASSGGKVLFIGTKKQAKEIVKKAAQDCQMPYATQRWLGGAFTNFGQIKKQIDKLIDLREKEKKGEFEKYTKKERLGLKDEMERLEKNIGGMVALDKLPDAVLIVDTNNDKIAFREALKKNIPVVATVDTNIDPTNITKPIPANDDGIKSIQIILDSLTFAIKEGMASKKEEKPQQKEKIKK